MRIKKRQEGRLVNITLSRAAGKPVRDYQEGKRSREAATRIGALEGGWEGGGHPSYQSPWVGVYNKAIHSIERTTVGR